MREIVKLLGLLLLLEGVSGAIDRVAVQPFMSAFLNFFNRVVVEHLDVLTGYELFANLALAALGGLLLVASRTSAPA
ncbi:hypothetical protein [Streptosporangium saharense]|uniref:Uncharacterized protein n=1 Tax=Streptosporangium saharense TaxID=1706840 RepID=A0A7W7QHL7_9ACTN|nr:hypothetical protein [Streptosporangium saharense]MBB4913750.1 hypothetical protein [Streptosporangium saharense]